MSLEIAYIHIDPEMRARLVAAYNERENNDEVTFRLNKALFDSISNILRSFRDQGAQSSEIASRLEDEVVSVFTTSTGLEMKDIRQVREFIRTAPRESLEKPIEELSLWAFGIIAASRKNHAIPLS